MAQDLKVCQLLMDVEGVLIFVEVSEVSGILCK